LLQDWGIDTKNKTDFYVYCHSDEAFNDALYRINVLRSLNTSAFFMYNCDNKKTRRILDLSKWCNRKMLYWKIPFEEYNRGLHK